MIKAYVPAAGTGKSNMGIPQIGPLHVITNEGYPRRRVYGKFHRDIPFAARAGVTHSESSMAKALSFSSPATLPRTLNRTFHSPHRRGTPLNDDREREIPPLGSYDTILLSSGRLGGQRIKHGFLQVERR
ncbi:hypothetical protein AOLI_G00280240 [Acnodon oligacanthus]